MTWYDGSWTLERGADSLRALGGRLARGRIIERQSGLFILACPACAALQINANILTGPDDSPTLAHPITCGAGRCKQCGVTFRIVGGRCQPCERPIPVVPAMPATLRAAGVHPPKRP